MSVYGLLHAYCIRPLCAVPGHQMPTANTCINAVQPIIRNTSYKHCRQHNDLLVCSCWAAAMELSPHCNSSWSGLVLCCSTGYMPAFQLQTIMTRSRTNTCSTYPGEYDKTMVLSALLPISLTLASDAGSSAAHSKSPLDASRICVAYNAMLLSAYVGKCERL